MAVKTPHTRRLKVLDERGQVVGEKEVVLYRGLLEMVHDERLHEVHTELIQAPSEENHDTAIVRATVRTARGSFTGIGDATPYNVDPKIVPHFIRMAETRAIARAMRVALAIGIASFEEFGRDADLVLDERETPRSDSQQGHSSFDHHRTPPRVTGQKFGSMRRDQAGGGNANANGNDGRASDNQRRFLFRLLAQRGKTGEAARAFIHETLGVASLDDAPRQAVSNLIDSLKSEVDGAYGHARGNGYSNGGSNGAQHGNGAHGGGA